MNRPPDPIPGGMPQDTPDEQTGPIPARPDYQVATPPVPTSALRPPRSVTWSFSLWITSFTAGLLATAYSLSQLDELRQLLTAQARARRPDMETDLLNRAVDLTLAVGLAGGSTVIMVQLGLAMLMRARHGWARYLLAIMGVFGLLATAFSLGTLTERAQIVLPVQTLLTAVAMVLMFLPSANAWFRYRPR